MENKDIEYAGLFVFRLKKEAKTLLSEIYPDVVVFSDDSLCEATYVFIPRELYSSDSSSVRGMLMGAYHEVIRADLSEGSREPKWFNQGDIDRMLRKVEIEVKKVSIGSVGHLEGFGEVKFYVSNIVDDILTVIPASVNMFKPVSVDSHSFKLIEDADDSVEFSYTSTLFIDCDMLPPLIGEIPMYSIYKNTLATILFNVHSLVDSVKIKLLNPCPLMSLAGMELGLETEEDKTLPVISDYSGCCVRLDPKKNYSVVGTRGVKRHEKKTEKITMRALIGLFNSLNTLSGLSLYETYQLFNRKYFNNSTILDMKFDYNPLEE